MTYKPSKVLILGSQLIVFGQTGLCLRRVDDSARAQDLAEEGLRPRVKILGRRVADG